MKTKKLGRILISLCLFAVVLGILGIFKYSQIKKQMAMGALMAPPPPAVGVQTVESEEWVEELKAVGSLSAYQGVTLTGKADAVVTEILFKSGQKVQAGDVLIRQESDVEKAQLAGAQARLELAELQRERARDLRDRLVNSQSELDIVEAEADKARAELESIQASIDLKQIKAPFDGVLGIRKVNLGQYLRAGDPVVNLESFNPMYVDFSLAQKNVATLTKGMKVGIHLNSHLGSVFEGSIDSIDPKVDPLSRQVRVRAILENEDGKLFSGMYCQVVVPAQKSDAYVTIPSRAVSYNPYGDLVYLVKKKEDGSYFVEQSFIEIVLREGDKVAVKSGIEAGSMIVISGHTKLRNAMPVRIKEDSNKLDESSLQLKDS